MVEVTTPCPSDSTALLEGARPRQLLRALTWTLDATSFASLTRHGNTTWAFSDLILQTLLWVWSGCSTLTGAFTHASDLCRSLLGRVALQSYQGFADALTTWTARVMTVLWQRLQQRMAAIAGEHWRIGQWLPLAVDGSRTTTPRTRANERALCPRRYGHGKKAQSRKKWKNKRRRTRKLTQPVHPQIWLTLLWHIGLRMPWAWKCGPSYASEREHFGELLETQEFPERTLFCGDAGFVGYNLWRAMIDRGHHFLIRVGGNVRLLRRLGTVKSRGEIVHFWPKAAAAKKQPPLTLRLLQFHTGRCTIFAVTSVLVEKDLTIDQAKQLYLSRWGVEVQFRSLKQTFGRSKLHSRTPERAYMELEWSLLGLWLIQLLAASEQIPNGIGPERSSVSVAVQVFRDAIGRYHPRCLRTALRAAVKDSYLRRSQKKARYRPDFGDKPSAGKPRIVMANAVDRQKYRQLTM